MCLFLKAGHENAGVVTGHIETNTPKFVPPRLGRPAFDPTQTGLCKFELWPVGGVNSSEEGGGAKYLFQG